MHGPIDDVYRRIRGNRTIVIRFIENAEVGISIIRSMAETREVQVENGKVTAELEADDEQISALMQRLVAEGVPHVLLRRQRTNPRRRLHARHQRRRRLTQTKLTAHCSLLIAHSS